ncbi:hypothetical protein [Gordonia aichiensis]|uniref:Condensation domain-containing protein n=1 Tax=Gordonia aichiensis NBRC 108223 TaxID=1220583 RepID=L7KLF3_9ACTN|nr:hypothetical protein [Gordonia aichiensis]GAC48518.1 hypothetical protein GOACH_06_00150 [Gordonia aichiensis NBRC 108223]
MAATTTSTSTTTTTATTQRQASAPVDSHAPALRVTGPDEAYLLAQDLFGIGSPIQYLWVFDDDPGADAVAELRAGLARGSLHRMVLRNRIPAARHRWVRSSLPAAGDDDATICDDAISQWADARVRDSGIEPVSGRGWRLDSATTPTGRRVVSLVVSHMVADGHGLFTALEAALSEHTAILHDSTAVGRRRAVREDIADAVGQLRAAARSAGVLVRAAWQQRRDQRSASTGSRTKPPKGASSSSELTDRPGPDTTLAIVDVDRAAWDECARAHGGTANSLFTALLAGIVAGSGLPVDDEMRVCIAVSTRDGDSDQRANASGGVWIRLQRLVAPGESLADIRALSKAAFGDYAAHRQQQVADNLQPVVRLLPRRVIASMMRSVPGPDTTVSNLGRVPDAVLRLGDSTASGFAVRALASGLPLQHRRERGPAVAAWAAEYGSRVTLTFFGIHPDHFGDPEALRAMIDRELTAWRLEHRFW